jgi:hypothetical protein
LFKAVERPFKGPSKDLWYKFKKLSKGVKRLLKVSQRPFRRPMENLVKSLFKGFLKALCKALKGFLRPFQGL